MTLRLVSDGFSQTGHAEEIAASARAFADKVEDGSLNAERVIVVCVIDGRLDLTVFGPSPTIATGWACLNWRRPRSSRGVGNESP